MTSELANSKEFKQRIENTENRNVRGKRPACFFSVFSSFRLFVSIGNCCQIWKFEIDESHLVSDIEELLY